ncbi:hypothetical protein JCGZ_04761 [Jatropha curcas]|uniref:Beta-Casp domain-containing protein n=1 Tax=Jatropha curcas TaxID=180498 RepID=A0A067KT13_JATCU|nr:hypothetical protein JCGZ_04761 [Jatropha curcas]
MLIGWTSQKVKETYSTHNPFDFKNVYNFDRSLIDAPGPCVLFATPGMISGGFSLEVFKHWAPSERNLVTLPGYCVAGTIGHKLMSGKPTKINLDKDTEVDVRCQIHQLSFSPHTDAKGIMDLVKFLSPKSVILVHGEKPKMASLKERIESEMGIQCYVPANSDTVCIPSSVFVKAGASEMFIRSCLSPNFKFLNRSSEDTSDLILHSTNSTSQLQVTDERVTNGILVMEKCKKARVVHQDELLLMLGKKQHDIRFAYCCPVYVENLDVARRELTTAHEVLDLSEKCCWLQQLFTELTTDFPGKCFQILGEHLEMESFHVSICMKDECPYRVMIDSPREKSTAMFFCCSWSVADEKFAWEIITTMEKCHLTIQKCNQKID